ncbi:propionyl-CoA synthetase [Roseovarius lutimaris]|uniref:Propionyl-CoA synthetase n=1 Tax=Roseovarius lutimaris TaxID=1005928 RepID=A0A1I5AHB1_9RHOB|nr:hypothetical protein [Roseovarius lutimaris]SFN61813.1 propionyl-CoA synthetase [Roseovarius lutimaris]
MPRYAETYAAWQNDPVGFWQELATRIDDAAPKVVISASCGIEPGRVIAYKPLLDEAIDLADNKPDHCVCERRSNTRPR